MYKRQQYFTELVDNAITCFEAMHRITGTGYTNTALYAWAATAYPTGSLASGDPPLHNWWGGRAGFVQAGLDPAKVGAAESVFEEEYILLALGLGKRLGYAVDSLFSFVASHFINVVTHPDFSPYLISAYRFPVRDINGTYFPTWAAAKAAYDPTWDAVAYFNANLDDPDHGYCYIGMAGLAMATREPNGQAAWNWIAAHVASDPRNVLNSNPKWALVPDTVGEIGPLPPKNLRVVK